MSTFSETITLKNKREAGNAKVGFIPESDVHSMTVSAFVDTGSWYLVINEEVRAALGLELDGVASVELADGTVKEFPITEPVEYRWKDRKSSIGAMLIPESSDVIFGAICMEALDLIVDPVDECLHGKHGDKTLHKLK
ncbi:MAG: hypothetical protein LBC77_08405 [Spirochaetaceae bacterium]|jgi:predicted aspartyl protease|nr:hypothetical protein [Spirochaetaceae bacterium]